jgi:hypothetical protein
MFMSLSSINLFVGYRKRCLFSWRCEPIVKILCGKMYSFRQSTSGRPDSHVSREYMLPMYIESN